MRDERTVMIVSVVALVVILLAGGAAAWWLQGQLSDLEKQKKSLQGQVDDMRQKQRELKKLEARVEELNAEIKKGNDRIPVLDILQYDELADKIDELRRLSSTFIDNVKFTPGGKAGVSAGGPPVPPSMNKAIYEIEISGGFFNLLRFLNLLEAQKRFIAVQSFSITAGAEQGGSGKTSTLIPVRDLKIQIYSFTRKDPSMMMRPGLPPQPGQPTGTTPPGVKPPEPEKPALSTPLPQ